MFRRGELLEALVAHRHGGVPRLGQRRFERPSPRGTFQRRAREDVADRHTRRQRLLDEAHSLGEGQAAPLPAAAQAEIPDQRVQRVTH
jgi:hypothetical protein